MFKKLKNLLFFSTCFFAISSSIYAYSGDISINSNKINFSHNNFLEGNNVRIYASVSNLSQKDLLGVVRFFDNGSQIGADQSVSIFAGNTDGIFVDWTPYKYGTHKLAIKLYPWEEEIDNPANNWAVKEVYVSPDTDRDGIANANDKDDDNDGVNDDEDAFPLNNKEQYDTDGDTKGDNEDLDDDNDGVPDTHDDLPLDPNETTDTDKDGIGNIADKDDDNDGLSDTEEENLKTNPNLFDTDGDGYSDKEDVFPLDKNEWQDSDKDKIGDNADKDDDNDGITDREDEYPLNKGPIIKLSDKQTVGLFKNHTFDASDSYDEDGKIKKYQWKIDGNTIKEEKASLNYKFYTKGSHILELKVTDDKGESRSTELEVNVINLVLYKQIAFVLMTIFLAIIIFLKYISKAKNFKKD